ncbi:TonB-dependent receptor domain-containing protein [Celeribacter sp. SCSIO 80788]|jgi:hemoglobin/transferrin/lactoferrin receptor protein|uniref:TonB-dependent receptor domain-containing protein n=1 Tax=Celeribacter sp. SCSIO 80788 TaxID=3117013 RepID=UPI003DA2F9CE
MKMARFVALCGVSYVAFASAGFAQDAIELDMITVSLVDEGQENVEATGGAVISEEELEALQPQNVSELFARESAVTVSGGAGPSKRIHVFGMEQSNLAVTVDGVPQGGTSWHHTGSNVVDPAFLKSVEVEAGAAAADAGFAAAAGAVRYETVSAFDLLAEGDVAGGRANLTYGNNGQGLSGSLASFGIYQNVDWMVMIHAQDGDNYEAGDGTEMPGSAPAAKGILSKFGYEFGTSRLELAYERSEDDADRVIKMNMDLNHDDAVYPLDVTRDTISLKYTSTAPTDMWDPEFMIYATQNDYWRPNYAAAFNGDMILDEDAFGGVVKNTFTLGAGTVTAGFDFSKADYDVDNYGDSTVVPQYQGMSTTQLGAFAQGRFAFANGIDLSAGLRADYHELEDMDGQTFEDAGLSANATLSYEFAPGFEIFAGGSRTWLGYDVGEYGLLHAADYSIDEDYEAGTSTNIKIGLNGTVGDFSGGITYFDTKIKDLASYLRSGNTGTISNSGEVRSKGVTLNGQYNWGTGRFGASYTKADVTEDGEFVLPEGGTVMPLGDLATVFVDQELPSMNMKVGATVEWAGKLDDDLMTASNYAAHDSYTVVNAYAEWKPERLEGATLRLGVDNLFDETYYERSSYVYREISATRTVYPALAAGRTVSLSMTLDF